MKKLFPLYILTVLFTACGNSPEYQESVIVNAKNITQETQHQINYYQSLIDSLIQVKNNLENEVSELKKKFDFKNQDLNGRSYYHKNWWGNYYISDQALLAGVDSLGNLFLIANVWTSSYQDVNLSNIQIIVDSAKYTAKSDTNFPELKNNIGVICACGFHYSVISGSEASKIGQIISQNVDRKITWVGITTLTKRDKIGIKESFELFEKLQLIFNIENQTEEINQQLTRALR